MNFIRSAEFYSTVNVLNNALNFTRWRREESTIRAGANSAQSAVIQSFMLSYAFAAMRESPLANALFGRVLNLNFTDMAPFFSGLALLLNAKATAVKINQYLKIDPETETKAPKTYRFAQWAASRLERTQKFMDDQVLFRRTVYLIHDNVGMCAQLAFLATSFGLIKTGRVAAGILNFAVVGADLACQKGVLPFAFRIRFYPIVLVAADVTQLITGGVAEKIYALIDLLLMAQKKYREYHLPPPVSLPPLVGEAVVGAVPIDLGTEYNPSTVANEAHLRPPVSNEDPNIDLESTLVAIRDSVVLEDKDLLRQAEYDDVLKKAIEKGNVQKTAPSIRIYVRKGIEKFAQRIVNRQILEGEPQKPEDYVELHKMAKRIAAALQSKDKITQKETIIALGLIGHYCGSGFFREVEAQHQAIVDINSTTLQEKVMVVLSRLREKLVLDYLACIQALGDVLGKSVDAGDIHVQNQLKGLLFKGFGLAEAGVRADQTVAVTSSEMIEWVKTATKWHYSRDPENKRLSNENDINISFKRILLLNYTSKAMCQIINEALGCNDLPFTMVRDWYVDWLSNRRGITRADAEIVFANEILILKENDIEGQPDYCQLKEPYILPMLIEMGALKIKRV